MTHFFNAFTKILGFLTAILIFIIIIGLIISLINRTNNNSSFIYLRGDSTSTNKIGVLNINGPIISEPANFYRFAGMGNFDAIYPTLIESYLTDLQKEKCWA